MENSVMTCVVGLIMPILLARISVNQRLPSGPAVIAGGSALGRGDRELGDGVRRRVDHPDLVRRDSVNQRLPSGPAVIEFGGAFGGGDGELGDGVRRRVEHPDLVAIASVNQRLPSGPVVMESGYVSSVGTINALEAYVVGLMLTIWSRPESPAGSVSQKLPSGPVVIAVI